MGSPHELATKNGGQAPDDPDIAARLQFLWEPYLKAVSLMITLCTGTLVVLISATFSEEKTSFIRSLDVGRRVLLFGCVILLTMSLVSALVWRGFSQLYMEKEVLGNPRRARAYLDSVGTDDHRYTFEELARPGRRRWWTGAMRTSLVTLGLGWFLLVAFFGTMLFG